MSQDIRGCPEIIGILNSVDYEKDRFILCYQSRKNELGGREDTERVGEDKIEVVPIEQAGRMILLLMTASLWVLPLGLTGNFLLIGTNCCRNSGQ